MTIEERTCPVRAITGGPRHHFFGYYDRCPWSASGRLMLGLEVDFTGRPPAPDDVARLGLIDPASGTFEPVAETRAWNWQQGCMLQWLPTAPDREIIYNDRVDGQLVAVVLDLQTGGRRVLPKPVYALSHDGRAAVAPSFARLADKHPGYGYLGVPDPWENDPQPDDDGIYWLDLVSGEHRLVLTLAEVVRFGHTQTMDGVEHWITHLQYNEDDSRIAFLHRWRRAQRSWYTQLCTIAADGSDLCRVADDELVSHFDWRDPKHILTWARLRECGCHYYLLEDRTGNAEAVGADLLLTDGHCSYSPDRRWILTDTYPDSKSRRTLLLYEPKTGRRVDIGRFYSPPGAAGEARCDLHPRWSRDGRQVCIDSAHEGGRQMYIVDVSSVVTARCPALREGRRS